MTVLFARLLRMVAGSLLANVCNSGSSSSSSSLQLPWALTSVDNKTQLHANDCNQQHSRVAPRSSLSSQFKLVPLDDSPPGYDRTGHTSSRLIYIGPLQPFYLYVYTITDNQVHATNPL